MKYRDSLKLLDEVRWNEPQSSLADLKAFIDSSIHWDFRNEIIAKIEQMRDHMEGSNKNDSLETKGGIKALRQIMIVFEYMILMKESDLTRKEFEEKMNAENDRNAQ